MATAAVQQAPGHTFAHTLERPIPETTSKKHDVTTELYYYRDDGSPPAPTYIGKPETNDRPSVAQQVIVHDIAGDENEYILDSHGFQIYKRQSAEKDFVDDDQIRAGYYPETEELLKDATGAVRVFILLEMASSMWTVRTKNGANRPLFLHIFDHTIRREATDMRNKDKIQLRGPVRRVHIDQSYAASVDRVSHHLPEEAEELLKKRFQIINVWRPIKPIFKDPLGVTAAHSVPDDDLVPTALIYPDRRGETLSVKPNPAHQWYYKYGQGTDEVTLIKCYDSKDDGRARRIPHTAFTNAEHEDKPARESIEVRALVFYDY